MLGLLGSFGEGSVMVVAHDIKRGRFGGVDCFVAAVAKAGSFGLRHSRFRLRFEGFL